MSSGFQFTKFFDIELEKPPLKPGQENLSSLPNHLFSQMRLHCVELDSIKTSQMDTELK
jgi:hypothetical protein